MAKMLGGVKKKVAAEIFGVSGRMAWKFWSCVLATSINLETLLNRCGRRDLNPRHRLGGPGS